MKITAIQANLVWENPEANRKAFDTQFEKLNGDEDLILLPEMFTTGFTSPNEDIVETMDGPTIIWLKEKARSLKAVLCGSLMICEQSKHINRMVWVTPNGDVQQYDKRHLFRMAGEHEHFEAGTERTIVELKGIRFCLQVCYDLRFPVWSRNVFDDGTYDYDCLLYVANWPSPRANAWRDLLRARAIENISYCIGLNRVGYDAKGLAYVGDSVILDYMGKDLARADSEEEMITAELDLSRLQAFRAKFPVGLDADRFEISR